MSWSDYDEEPESGPRSFDDWRVRVFVPPLLIALAFAANASPLKFFLTGFHVWMHELGHATAAWMTGRRATPLPIGWTSYDPEFSPFVYWGVLFLFGVLAWAGWTQRRFVAVGIAVVGAAAQYWMTWRTPEYTQQLWLAFCGIGGEFYLSTLFMAAFFVRLPEKFRWSICRYVVFFVAASCLLNIWLMWQKVYTGVEEIPFGTMIHGEEDAGGDMNILKDDYGWTHFQIRRTYHLLGQGCLVAFAACYAFFALRLDHLPSLFRRAESAAE
jgi:hypothetical protein